MNVKKVVIYIDDETGEIIRQRSFSHKPKKQKPGQFFWFFYKLGEPIAYSGSELVAIANLAQNMGSNNELLRPQGDSIPKEALPLFVAKEKTLGYKRIKAWKQSGLLVETDGVFYLNSQIVRKGSLRTVNKDELKKSGVRIIRICYDGIQAMERDSTVQKLGKLFLLLPHLNIEHNIISDSIDELELERVVPMSAEAIAAVWGNKATSSRFIDNYLLETKVRIRNYEQSIVKLINGKYVVNPRLFYGGSQFQEVAKKFFE